MIKNVIEYLQHAAQKYPNKTAFIDQTGSVTFRGLDSWARQIAVLIQKSCPGTRNQPIAVYMGKGIRCLAAFLGVVYSGNFYAPLDVKSPPERIARILNVLQPAAVLCDNPLPAAMALSCPQVDMLAVGDEQEVIPFVDAFQFILDVDPLYVMFTSGSTGQPKGVVISHRSVIDYVEWLEDTFEFSDKTVFGNQAPFYFDNSILDIYSTIKNGAEMVIIPERLFTFPKSLIEYINNQQINTLFWVPSALIGVANSGILEKVEIPLLKKVLFCGEVMPNKQLNIWRRRFPDVMYANLYGPTEITDVCTYYIVDRQFADEEPLPIGFPCRNTEVLVLNEADQAVQGDETGELCVRGICLSAGYYNNDDKTAAVFVQNPLNKGYRDIIYRTGDLVRYNERGEILYIGRKDFQIKHQGYRIELGEIEAAAYGIAQMKQCCAVYDTENRCIVVYCVLYAPLSEKEIFLSLKEKIPGYMLPKRIFIEDTLPLNANGKIDRLALGSRHMEKNYPQ